MLKRLLAAAGLMFCCAAAPALELQGTQASHDPSTLIKDGDTYFHFTTGDRIWYSTSKDLVTWTGGPGPVFSTYPAWIKNKIPTWTADDDIWAPDIIHMNGYYYLYYSVSKFGSSNSAIGVVRSASLKAPSWTDLGIVVESFGGSSEINAIDPALFRDHDGKVYMSYGSFHGGIGLAEINQTTGKLASSVTKIHGGGHADIEAPYIVRNGGYYYLFVNRGACCKGSDSTYYVQVLRSSSVTGPYSGARTVLPNVDGRFKGPGHIGVLKQDGCSYVSTHYYDLNAAGAAKLSILKMTYDSNGWPVLTRNFSSITSCGGISDGLYSFKSRLSGKMMEVAGASTTNGAAVQQWTDNGNRTQRWYVVGHGDGYYSVLNANSLQSLDVFEQSMTAGAKITQWPYWGGNGQKYAFASPSAGYHVLTSRLSGMALDVNGKSTADGAAIIQWTVNNGTNQQWQLIRR